MYAYEYTILYKVLVYVSKTKTFDLRGTPVLSLLVDNHLNQYHLELLRCVYYDQRCCSVSPTLSTRSEKPHDDWSGRKRPRGARWSHQERSGRCEKEAPTAAASPSRQKSACAKISKITYLSSGPNRPLTKCESHRRRLRSTSGRSTGRIFQTSFRIS